MAIVVDAHSDILSDLLGRRAAGQTGILNGTWIPAMDAGGIDVRVLAIYSGVAYLPELALRRALDQVAALHAELDETPRAALCTTPADVLAATGAGKKAFILGMEGVEPLGSDLGLFRIFHQLGVRVLGITHALRNYAADGAFFEPKRTGVVGGLSDFGVELVEAAQAMGMLLDVSHLNDPGFWDVVKLSRRRSSPRTPTAAPWRTIRATSPTSRSRPSPTPAGSSASTPSTGSWSRRTCPTCSITSIVWSRSPAGSTSGSAWTSATTCWSTRARWSGPGCGRAPTCPWTAWRAITTSPRSPGCWQRAAIPPTPSTMIMGENFLSGVSGRRAPLTRRSARRCKSHHCVFSRNIANDSWGKPTTPIAFRMPSGMQSYQPYEPTPGVSS